MCGIYGAASPRGAPPPGSDLLAAMAAALRHRGPDDQGLLVSDVAAAGVERLRITDLTPAAAQPFEDPHGGVWVSANGAIYNAAELRSRYYRYPYRSRSDVEPIVPLYLDRGPEGLAELDGMFAVAIWDRRDSRLTLARDRAGEKPLFYTVQRDTVLYASEVAALLVDRRVPRDLDDAAEAEFLAFGYVREPRTLFRSVHQIRAGAIMTFDRSGTHERVYWKPDLIAVEPVARETAVGRLDQCLRAAVQRQVAADVPIGVFTSGGVDSSLIAAMAAEARGRDQVRSLSVGFPEGSYDERPPARRVARALGIAHVEVQADRATLTATLDEITGTLAEPIADPALLPTLVLARAAREHVGVVLSGEGADELFWGYPTYLGHRLAGRWNGWPAAVRRLAAAAAAAVPASDAKVPVRHLLARFTAHAGDEPVRRHVAWFGTGLLPWLEPPATAQLDLTLPPGDDVVRRLALFDYGTYLRDGLLPKIDRATMRAGLEARAPYLDSAVTAFALSLPAHLKLRGMTQKWILKRVARARLPAWVSRRRKRGLSVPIAAWLRGPLRGEVERLADGIVGSHLLNPERIGQLASDHLTRRADHARALWALVVYARFHQRWIGGA